MEKKKKKLFLISFFKSRNIGDILIAKQVSNIFGDAYYTTKACTGSYCVVDDAQLVQSEPHLETVSIKRRLIKRFPIIAEIFAFIRIIKNNNLDEFKKQSTDSDMVMVAGGNVIMDLGLFPIYTYQIMNLVKTAKKEGKAVFFCFIGVGPLNTKQQKKYAKNAIEMADFISVRDDISYDLVKSLNLKKEVEIWRDPVLFLIPPTGFDSAKAFGVNVYFGHKGNRKSKEKICYAFANIIKKLRIEKPDYKVYLFSSELSDISDIKQVKKFLIEDDDMISIYNIKSSKELFDFYNKVSVVLGTRMHTIITALVCRKPVVSICWQDKVRGLVNHFNLEDNFFEITNIYRDVDKIVSALLRCEKNNDAFKLEIEEKIKLTNKNTIEKVKKFIDETR